MTKVLIVMTETLSRQWRVTKQDPLMLNKDFETNPYLNWSQREKLSFHTQCQPVSPLLVNKTKTSSPLSYNSYMVTTLLWGIYKYLVISYKDVMKPFVTALLWCWEVGKFICFKMSIVFCHALGIMSQCQCSAVVPSNHHPPLKQKTEKTFWRFCLPLLKVGRHRKTFLFGNKWLRTSGSLTALIFRCHSNPHNYIVVRCNDWNWLIIAIIKSIGIQLV